MHYNKTTQVASLPLHFQSTERGGSIYIIRSHFHRRLKFRLWKKKNTIKNAKCEINCHRYSAPRRYSLSKLGPHFWSTRSRSGREKLPAARYAGSSYSYCARLVFLARRLSLNRQMHTCRRYCLVPEAAGREYWNINRISMRGARKLHVRTREPAKFGYGGSPRAGPKNFSAATIITAVSVLRPVIGFFSHRRTLVARTLFAALDYAEHRREWKGRNANRVVARGGTISGARYRSNASRFQLLNMRLARPPEWPSMFYREETFRVVCFGGGIFSRGDREYRMSFVFTWYEASRVGKEDNL